MSSAVNFTKRRWRVLLLYGIINLCVGGLYAWSVFAIPLQQRLGVESLSLVYTLSTSIGFVPMIIGGTLQQKVGTKRLLLVSGVMFGVGMILSGIVGNQIALMITYGLLCGLGAGLAYGCTVGNAVKLFPDKRGLAGGISAATYGGSAIILPPIATVLIEKLQVTWAFRVLGIVFLVVICICALLVEECPANFVPDGWTPPTGQKNLTESKSPKQMVTTPVFYIMLLLLLCGAVSGSMMISQASPMAQNLAQMPVAMASMMVSILSLFNVLGRVISGMLSDKIGRINTLTIILVCSLIGLVLLSTSSAGAFLHFGAGLSIVGFGFGTFLGVFPGFTADQFGPKHQSINYGIMFIGFALAGLIGPNVASAVFVSSGTYSLAFYVGMALCVVGILLSVLFRVMTRVRKSK